MVQQIVSRRDTSKHFANVSGGLGFVTHSHRTSAGSAALRSSAHLLSLAEAHSSKTAASIFESAATPQRTFPIFSGSTNRKHPARVFLSACMAVIKRAEEAPGHDGSGPTRVIK
jgi:hypothetical protein